MLRWIFVWRIVFFSGSIITPVCLFLSPAVLWPCCQMVVRLELTSVGYYWHPSCWDSMTLCTGAHGKRPTPQGEGVGDHHRPPQSLCLLWGWTMQCSQRKNWLPTHNMCTNYTSVHTVNKDNPLHVSVNTRELCQRISWMGIWFPYAGTFFIFLHGTFFLKDVTVKTISGIWVSSLGKLTIDTFILIWMPGKSSICAFLWNCHFMNKVFLFFKIIVRCLIIKIWTKMIQF